MSYFDGGTAGSEIAVKGQQARLPKGIENSPHPLLPSATAAGGEGTKGFKFASQNAAASIFHAFTRGDQAQEQLAGGGLGFAGQGGEDFLGAAGQGTAHPAECS